MKTRILSAAPAFLLAAALFAGGCESPTSSVDESVDASADLTTVLSQELDLTSAQQQGVETELRRHNKPDVNPGSLWFLAARLQQELEPGQKERLLRLAQNARGPQLHKLAGVYGPCRLGPPDGDRPLHIRLIVDLLTDEQRTSIEDIRARYHDEIQELHEQVRNGELSREDFQSQLETLHEAMTEELLGLLTEDQITALEERMAQRGADAEAMADSVKQAMIEALGLDEAQAASVETLHETQCATLESLVEQARAGDITREDLQSEVAQLVSEKMAALAGILDAVQLEIVEIHDALLLVHGRRFMNHMGGPQGHMTGGPNGQMPGGRGVGGPQSGGEQGRHGGMGGN